MNGQKATTTAQRLRTIMSIRDLRQVDILEMAKPYCLQYKVKLNKNDLSQYCSGKVEPAQDKLTILSMALGVTEPWLMGYDVPMLKENQPVDDRLADEFITLFNQLSPDKQHAILAAMKAFLTAQGSSSAAHE